MKTSKHTEKIIRQLQERFGILELRNRVIFQLSVENFQFQLSK